MNCLTAVLQKMGTIRFAFPVEWLVERKEDFDIPTLALLQQETVKTQKIKHEK